MAVGEGCLSFICCFDTRELLPLASSQFHPQSLHLMSRILLGVTGSIAAYKAADIASQLTKLGHHVTCICTRAALEFVTPLTLQTLSRHPVISDLFAEKDGWQPGHIHLADSADLLLIAPASANILASMAHGFASDALTAIALATRAPILIAPAMNGKMWQHPATQMNVEQLKKWGATFIEPAEGLLACGYEGVGRLAGVEEIIATAAALLGEGKAESV
jgi:phosphopantothenoylcysteine synthetase/decarboxylase